MERTTTSIIDRTTNDELAFRMRRAIGRVASKKIETAYAAQDPGEDWRKRGLCMQVDNDMFFPEVGGSPENAKKVCALCPVRAPCLQFAIDHDVQGVWAGTTERERRGLRKSAIETPSE
jgi:WhiB family redox-sensing transcriptional regulator